MRRRAGEHSQHRWHQQLPSQRESFYLCVRTLERFIYCLHCNVLIGWLCILMPGYIFIFIFFVIYIFDGTRLLCPTLSARPPLFASSPLPLSAGKGNMPYNPGKRKWPFSVMAISFWYRNCANFVYVFVQFHSLPLRFMSTPTMPEYTQYSVTAFCLAGWWNLISF